MPPPLPVEGVVALRLSCSPVAGHRCSRQPAAAAGAAAAAWPAVLHAVGGASDVRAPCRRPAVRGAIAIKSAAYSQQLAEGKGGDLPFTKVYECNIGNPQILGQARGWAALHACRRAQAAPPPRATLQPPPPRLAPRGCRSARHTVCRHAPLRCRPARPLQKPITFFRQVLSLCEYPELMEHPGAAAIYPPDAIAVRAGQQGAMRAAARRVSVSSTGRLRQPL